jgi:hypothetical protein
MGLCFKRKRLSAAVKAAIPRVQLRYQLAEGIPSKNPKSEFPMPIVALAFHEQLAIEKLDRYFASAEAAGGESRAMNCGKCELAFAVVLVNRSDRKNPQYIEDLQTLIEQDCIAGLHRDEYSLAVGAPSQESPKEESDT